MSDDLPEVSGQQILDKAHSLEDLYRPVLRQANNFEIKGILNSEMLFFLSVAELLGVKRVIESGRARAQSTVVLANWIKSVATCIQHFDSYEFDARSEDVGVAANRLSGLEPWVNCHFGDASQSIPAVLGQFTEPAMILIDGPKGLDALSLAVNCLHFKQVRAVCIHDLHRDDTRLRKLIETYWPRHQASDDETFVAQFARLDKSCWDAHQLEPEFTGWGPYQRGRRRMHSYGPTLMCLFADTARLPAFKARVERLKGSLDSNRAVIKSISWIIPERIRKAAFARKFINRILQ